MLRLFHLIIARCIGDKFVRSPVIPKRIYIVGFPVDCRYHIQRFPFRVPSMLHYLFAKMRRHAGDILHKLHRLCKDSFIHSLKNNINVSHLRQIELKQISIINMTASVRHVVNQLSIILKMLYHFSSSFFGYLRHYLSSHKFSGYNSLSFIS